MTSGQGSGGNWSPIQERGHPALLGRWNVVGTAHTQTYTNSGGVPAILLGADWTATQANPVQCFTQMFYNTGGAIFFWDSQSTGEGNGVRWSWRGALIIPAGQGVSIVTTAVSAITLGGIMWGAIGDWYGYLYD